MEVYFQENLYLYPYNIVIYPFSSNYFPGPLLYIYYTNWIMINQPILNNYLPEIEQQAISEED